MADTGVFPNFSGPDLPARVTAEQARANRFTQAALERHKQEGIWLAVRARWAVLAVIAVLLLVLNPDPEMLYYYPFLAASALVGWLQTRVGRVGRSGAELAVLFCDVAIFVWALMMPNPFSDNDWPTAMLFRFENFSYLFLLLALATLSYSWRTIIAVGNWTCAMWLAGLVWLWWTAEPWPVLSAATEAAFGFDPEMRDVLDPTSFRFDVQMQHMVVFLMVALTLAVSIRRFNRLLLDNAGLERERANLSRYFSPNVVEELSNNDEPLKQIRAHDVAILFVDLKGFTRFASGRSAEAVIGTLREFHARMEAAVFAHDGTLDKYLGDGLMASFGTPLPAADDAERAFRCARQMIVQAAAWNAERAGRGEEALEVSVGVHYGPAVLGDIGAARLEFAVIGNTVNVASRVEGLTRHLGAALVISDDLYQRLPATLVQPLRHDGPQEVAGLDQPVTVWSEASPGTG
jgi:adenylate cyclase